MRSICVLSLIAFAGCASSARSTAPAQPPPAQPAPTYTEPAALPGTYQPGLGNPFIQIQNNLDYDLSISVTDGAGYSHNAYVYPHSTYDLTVSPGTFQYYASANGQSDSGSYSVEYDNAYTWSWTTDYGSASYGSSGGSGTYSSGYTWSEAGKREFMEGCTGEGAAWSVCDCSMSELQKRYSEDYVASQQLTSSQIDEVLDICMGPGDYQ
jgi:hypothetical protein